MVPTVFGALSPLCLVRSSSRVPFSGSAPVLGMVSCPPLIFISARGRWWSCLCLWVCFLRMIPRWWRSCSWRLCRRLAWWLVWCCVWCCVWWRLMWSRLMWWHLVHRWLVWRRLVRWRLVWRWLVWRWLVVSRRWIVSRWRSVSRIVGWMRVPWMRPMVWRRLWPCRRLRFWLPLVPLLLRRRRRSPGGRGLRLGLGSLGNGWSLGKGLGSHVLQIRKSFTGGILGIWVCSRCFACFRVSRLLLGGARLVAGFADTLRRICGRGALCCSGSSRFAHEADRLWRRNFSGAGLRRWWLEGECGRYLGETGHAWHQRHRCTHWGWTNCRCHEQWICRLGFRRRRDNHRIEIRPWCFQEWRPFGQSFS
mmetsp:Transcript_65428/g.114042  ORF Transcript_65428/g.114042 Transcript_65428/m.114042 type:complete len:364 (+) Transcript_65428:859-1950(+)